MRPWSSRKLIGLKIFVSLSFKLEGAYTLMEKKLTFFCFLCHHVSHPLQIGAFFLTIHIYTPEKCP